MGASSGASAEGIEMDGDGDGRVRVRLLFGYCNRVLFLFSFS